MEERKGPGEGGWRRNVLHDWELVPDGAEDSTLQPPSSHVWPPGDCLARHTASHLSTKSKMQIEDAN